MSKLLQTQHVEECPLCGHVNHVGNTAWVYLCMGCRKHVNLMERWYDEHPEHHVMYSVNYLIKDEEDYALTWNELPSTDKRRIGLVWAREMAAMKRSWKR